MDIVDGVMPATPHAARIIAVVAALVLLATGCRAEARTTMLAGASEAEVWVADDPLNDDQSTGEPFDDDDSLDDSDNFDDRDGDAENLGEPDDEGDADEGEATEGESADQTDDDGEAGREPIDIDRGGRTSPLDAMERVEIPPTPTPEPTEAPEPASPGALDGGEVDFTLTRDDVDCDDETLNEDRDTPFLVAHVVVNGNLGAPCFGDADERLTDAWEVLATITPSGQLRDLGLFGGYESRETGETTLAFVNTLDDEGSLFQMSINLEQAAADPDELMLTMAHEFSHVFTSLSTQLDRNLGIGTCPTFFNGEGCFVEGSLMAEWTELFWTDDLLDDINRLEGPSNASGAELCNLDPSFLGPYAASDPEEDFAETFSGFVFRLEVNTPELQAKLDWFADQPGLAEFQELAIAAGLGPLDNSFEECGP